MSEDARLPNSWTTLTVADAVRNISTSGKKIPQNQYLESGAFPVIDQGQPKIGGFTNDTSKLVDCDPPVIVFGDHTKVVKLITSRFAPGADGVKVLKPHGFFDPRLFKLLLDRVVLGLIDKGYARHYQHLAKTTIPLPPLAEQKRIVAKIEELFSELEAGEESLRVARRQLGVYRQSLLKQAFKGHLTAKWRAQNPTKLESAAQLLAHIQSARQPRAEATRSKLTSLTPFPADELVGDFTLPAGWLVLAYGDLCSVVRNGISQKPSGDTGHKIARISAVRPMVFDYEDYRFIDCDDETAADYTLSSGDIIFTRYNGARRYVGVCAQFKGQEPRLYPDKLIRTRPHLSLLDPRYLEIALNCGLSRAWLETKIRTTAGQSGVSGGDVKAMPVAVCSLPEQQEIVRLLDEQFEVIERNEREIDRALRKSVALRQAILQKAFIGRLVPQDPADEPATQLLARLRAARSGTSSSSPSSSSSSSSPSTSPSSASKPSDGRSRRRRASVDHD